MNMFSRPNKILALTISPTLVTCSLISGHDKGSPLPLFTVNKYATFACDQNELHKAIVFNPTAIARFISSCATNWHAQHVPASIALQGDNIYEAIVATPTATPNAQELKLPIDPLWDWHIRQLYQAADNSFVFYVAGIQRPISLQYHLLMHQARLSLARLTTMRMSLLFLYKHLYGAAFRPSALGEKLRQKNNTIEELLSSDLLGRIAHIMPQEGLNRDKQALPLLCACALLASERDA